MLLDFVADTNGSECKVITVAVVVSRDIPSRNWFLIVHCIIPNDTTEDSRLLDELFEARYSVWTIYLLRNRRQRSVKITLHQYSEEIVYRTLLPARNLLSRRKLLGISTWFMCVHRESKPQKPSLARMIPRIVPPDRITSGIRDPGYLHDLCYSSGYWYWLVLTGIAKAQKNILSYHNPSNALWGRSFLEKFKSVDGGPTV